jgi:hypothetical protein
MAEPATRRLSNHKKLTRRLGPLHRTHAIPPRSVRWRGNKEVRMSGSFERIVAIDLGKFKSVACVRRVADRSEVVETIESSPKPVHDLIARRMANEPTDRD